MLNRTFAIGLGILSFSICSASPVSDNFGSSADYAKAASNSIGNTVNNFDPSAEFANTQLPNGTTLNFNYTENPQQTEYYNNPGAIGDAAISAETTDTAGAAIGTSMMTRPQYQINSDSPDIQRSILMQQQAYNITHGISNQYIDCQQQKNCHVTYTEATCQNSSQSKLACYVTPVVKIVDVPYNDTISYGGSITPTSASTGNIVLPEEGTITAISVNLSSGNVWRCNVPYYASLNGVTFGSFTGHCGSQLGGMNFSGNGLSIPGSKVNPNLFKFWGGQINGGWSNSSYSITLKVTRYKPEPQITLQNSCTSIPSQCSMTDTKCIDPGETRTFDGLAVSQDCWKTQQVYTCGSSDDHSCDALKNKGCSQLNSKCAVSVSGVCLSYDVTYQCGETICDGGSSNICGDNYFCIDGECYEPKPEKNQNFGKDDAEIAAAAGAAQSITGNQDSLLAFTGQAASCSEAPIGFLSCCADSGWGKEVGLSSCSDEEKQLGLSKEKGYTVYVGEYCANSVLGVCTSSRKAYCEFDGFMALDVQYQGRYQQLGIGFGDPKSPNCSGITIDQLQKIDFSKIDFSNLTSQLTNQANFPNASDIKNRIEQDIQHRMGP